MATNIPAAREKLREAMDIIRDIQTLESAEALRLIHGALSMMKRKQRHTNRRIIARKVTSEIVHQVNLHIQAAGWKTDLEIGAVFNIGPGRVNEIRNGLRTIEKPSISKDGYNRILSDLKEGIQ
tara:strand:+ start:17867 stop:18238 length:372 start_codon:yes stop_codon:yes gene_type:complete